MPSAKTPSSLLIRIFRGEAIERRYCPTHVRPTPLSSAPTLEEITSALEALEAEAAAAIAEAPDAAALEQLRIDLLGKKGKLSGVLGAMGKLPGDQRPVVGQRANVLRHGLHTQCGGQLRIQPHTSPVVVADTHSRE